jgi:hypothetical protein
VAGSTDQLATPPGKWARRLNEDALPDPSAYRGVAQVYVRERWWSEGGLSLVFVVGRLQRFDDGEWVVLHEREVAADIQQFVTGAQYWAETTAGGDEVLQPWPEPPGTMEILAAVERLVSLHGYTAHNPRGAAAIVHAHSEGVLNA